MKWNKATEQTPPIGAIKRQISQNRIITNDFIWKQHENYIEMDNQSAILGDSIHFDDIEWLDENKMSDNLKSAKAVLEQIIKDTNEVDNPQAGSTTADLQLFYERMCANRDDAERLLEELSKK